MNNAVNNFLFFQIKYLQSRDNGMYECQVSTQPVRSFFVRLNILGKTLSNLFRIHGTAASSFSMQLPAEVENMYLE